MQEKFGGLRKSPYLCTRNQGTTRLQYKIGIWCNGNTADSGPAFPGSSPGIPTTKESAILGLRSFFLKKLKGTCSLKYHTLLLRIFLYETSTPKEKSRSALPY